MNVFPFPLYLFKYCQRFFKNQYVLFNLRKERRKKTFLFWRKDFYVLKGKRTRTYEKGQDVTGHSSFIRQG